MLSYFLRRRLLRQSVTLSLITALLLSQCAVALAAVAERHNYKWLTLERPQALAPLDEVLTLQPEFDWTAVPEASSYEFDLLEADGTRVFRRDGLTTDSFTLPGEVRLDHDRDYYFVIRAYDHRTHRASEYSQPACFRPVRQYSNLSPTATFTADPSGGYTPLKVVLDGSGSLDSDGTRSSTMHGI